MSKEPLKHYWPSLIGQVRSILQLNQHAFAEKLGTTQASVSRWEKGERIPLPEFQGKIERMAQETRVESINGLLKIVEASPFPIIITDEFANVLAASSSSGFRSGLAVFDQTPEDEQENFKKFSEALRMSGFWKEDGIRYDYQFLTGAYLRRAVVQSIMVRGIVYAVVQRLD